MEDRFNSYNPPTDQAVYHDTYMEYADQGHRTAHLAARFAANVSVRKLAGQAERVQSQVETLHAEMAGSDVTVDDGLLPFERELQSGQGRDTMAE